MTPHWIDHVAFVFLGVVYPIWGFFAMRKLAARIRAGQVGARMRLYRQTIFEEWSMAIVVLGFWFALGRSGAAIGLSPPGGGLAWVGYGLAFAICAFLLLQAWSVIRSLEGRASMRKQVDSLSIYLPQTRNERRTFDFVSLTAGICEEVIFRGFLITYLMVVLGAPFWVAALLSSVLFGLLHAYQGPIGVVRIAAVGGMFALLYGLTGTLWASIVVHAVMDQTSGHMGFAALTKDSPDHSSAEATA